MKIVELSGEKFKLMPLTDTHHELPVGVYQLDFDPREGFFLVQRPMFTLPGKLYSTKELEMVPRWLQTWKDTGKNLGIALAGVKGTGKTIAAKKFCIDSGRPVILITQDYSGDLETAFINFITSPKFQNSVIFIDEFEKIFNKDHWGDKIPTYILQLMDGSYSTNFAFVLTSNKTEFNEYLTNRLGRIRYIQRYSYLSEETCRMVVADKLQDASQIDPVVAFLEKAVEFKTMDIVTTICDEINRYGEPVEECTKYLNLILESKQFNIFYELPDRLDMTAVRVQFPFSRDHNEVYVPFTSGLMAYLKLGEETSPEDFQPIAELFAADLYDDEDDLFEELLRSDKKIETSKVDKMRDAMGGVHIPIDMLQIIPTNGQVELTFKDPRYKLFPKIVLKPQTYTNYSLLV